MSQIPYKFDGLRSLLTTLRMLSAITAAAAIFAVVMRVASPGINTATYRALPPDWMGAAVIFGAGVGQMLFVWIFANIIELLIERERNDRVTHALLMRLIRRTEIEQDQEAKKG